MKRLKLDRENGMNNRKKETERKRKWIERKSRKGESKEKTVCRIEKTKRG